MRLIYIVHLQVVEMQKGEADHITVDYSAPATETSTYKWIRDYKKDQTATILFDGKISMLTFYCIYYII